jgi:hypothetical protein
MSHQFRRGLVKIANKRWVGTNVHLANNYPLQASMSTVHLATTIANFERFRLKRAIDDNALAFLKWKRPLKVDGEKLESQTAASNFHAISQ